jgi:hypothetical protein
MRRPIRFVLLAAVLLPLAGCDQLGIESANAVAAKREAEGKAVGGACRHAARSIEECYAANKRADKAAVFAGWREMNDYMRENKMEAMPSAAEGSAAADAQSGESTNDAPAKKTPGKDGNPKAAAAKASGSRPG